MPLTYSQWIWGFEIFDSGPKQNNLIDFESDGGSPKLATLSAGVYTPDEFAAAVRDALVKGYGANTYAASFDFSTLRFTIAQTSGSSFSLKFGTGPNPTTSAGTLLGFHVGSNPADDIPSVTTAGPVFTVVTPVVGLGNSSASVWAAAEPLNYSTPVTAQSASGIPGTGLFTQRSIHTSQHVSDGATVESIYFSTVKKVMIGFRALLPAEQTKMEQFLDWTVQGKRFTWQPDKTSPNAVKLVLANPGQIGPMFEWLTRSETSYGVLTFFEQAS